jgi:hypothetical protein
MRLGPGKSRKIHLNGSHGDIKKFYRPQGRKRWNIRIKTKEYQLMADLDKNRHDFLQTLRKFNSKLKPDIVLINESTKDIIIGELTCPMEAHMTYWHETKTTKYHDLANRMVSQSVSSLLKLAAEVWLEDIAQIPHCIGTSKEDH